jgi:hypothetical protein
MSGTNIIMNPLINLVLFCYCSVAFYVAITNYVTDGSDRALIQSQYHTYNDKLIAVSGARFIQESCVSKSAQIVDLTAACEALQVRLANVTLPNVTYYAEMDAQGRQCNENINALNRTLQELRANATVHTLNNGYCTMSTDLASVSVLFFYKRAIVNGIDFYYYHFPTSQVLPTNSTDVQLSGCIPYIFSGPPIRQGYKSGLLITGGATIDFGSNVINITLTQGYQTVQLSDFQIWTRGI